MLRHSSDNLICCTPIETGSLGVRCYGIRVFLELPSSAKNVIDEVGLQLENPYDPITKMTNEHNFIIWGIVTNFINKVLPYNSYILKLKLLKKTANDF
jgi:hypothetical protein